MLAESKNLATPDSLEAALEWHDGDHEATIETLLEDCRFLRQQLLLARGCISHGLTRGWMPELDRR